MQIQPILLGGAKPISGQGRGPKPEAQRAERGIGFSGKGQPAPSQPARESRERCKLPQRESFLAF